MTLYNNTLTAYSSTVVKCDCCTSNRTNVLHISLIISVFVLY